MLAKAEISTRKPRLPDEIVQREKLDGSVADPVDADLAVRDDAEPVFQADLARRNRGRKNRSSQAAKVALAERTREPVRHAEGALECRQPQPGGQRDEREVRLRRIEHRRIIIRLLGMRHGSEDATRQHHRKRHGQRLR